tara:strand:- start:899 stop:1669 length:771 start_codon:yes stop_codon:yes gene_type:complete
MVIDQSLFYYSYYNQKDKIVLVSWEMKNDIEVVTIYNDGLTTTYTFLDNLLPHDLRFFVLGSSGRQYISMNWGSKKKYEYDWVIADQGDKDFYLPKDMTKPLQFARKHAKWQHVGTEYVFKYAMTQVNKEAKSNIKPYSDKFYEWVITMHGMLPCDDYQYNYKMEQEMHQHMQDNKLAYYDRIDEYKKIMRDESHPMRLHLAVDWLRESPLFGYRGRQDIDTKDKASKVRASWNRWVNKTLGLTKNVHEARTEEVK